MIWALLDSCSDRDYFSDEVVSKLGIKVTEHVMRTTTVEGKVCSLKFVGSVSLTSIDNKYEAIVDDAVFAYFSPASTDIPPVTVI